MDIKREKKNERSVSVLGTGRRKGKERIREGFRKEKRWEGNCMKAEGVIEGGMKGDEANNRENWRK